MVLSMKDNKSHALKVQLATEARIQKQGYTEQYNEIIPKYLDSRALVPITEEEKLTYTGRVPTIPRISGIPDFLGKVYFSP